MITIGQRYRHKCGMIVEVLNQAPSYESSWATCKVVYSIDASYKIGFQGDWMVAEKPFWDLLSGQEVSKQ